jgi:hypothetical protein
MLTLSMLLAVGAIAVAGELTASRLAEDNVKPAPARPARPSLATGLPHLGHQLLVAVVHLSLNKTLSGHWDHSSPLCLPMSTTMRV